ncbi:MAG: sulfate permease [Prevotellaceae bacterium]|nr:sulfate permease [Prevotellaceae bacterium]
MKSEIFHPELLTTIKTYSRKQLAQDVIAGIIVGIVALPLAIAFGIASGVTPEKGIITAIVAGFIISFFGGSRVQIGGPTGAFIVIVAGVVSAYGLSGLMIATFLAGILLIIMGLLKLGDVIKFMPYPVIVGFTSGIALVIFSTQIKDFFGLTMPETPTEFHEKWVAYFRHFSSANLHATGIALFTALVSVFWAKVNKLIPGTLIAIVITTALVSIFDMPVETIGSRFGSIDAHMPAPTVPEIDFASFRKLLPVAFTIAMLGAIESLLSAMVADGAIGAKHRSNTELIAQGIANMVTPLFGGIPATGAIARTMTNIKNGGRTPVAGLVHTATLLLILLIFAKWAKLIPMSCLAGILVVVAYNMSEWRSFAGIFRNSRSEVAVLLTTFLLTVIFDLTIAIEVGLVLALFLFVRRISKATGVQVIKEKIAPGETEQEVLTEEALSIPKGVDVFEIDGPFFFGVANRFEEAQKQVVRPPKVRIIRMRKVPFMDSTGLRNLRSFYRKCKGEKIHILLSGVNPSVESSLKTDGLYDVIGADNIFDHISKAMKRAEELVGKN